MALHLCFTVTTMSSSDLSPVATPVQFMPIFKKPKIPKRFKVVNQYVDDVTAELEKTRFDNQMHEDVEHRVRVDLAAVQWELKNTQRELKEKTDELAVLAGVKIDFEDAQAKIVEYEKKVFELEDALLHVRERNKKWFTSYHSMEDRLCDERDAAKKMLKEAEEAKQKVIEELREMRKQRDGLMEDLAVETAHANQLLAEVRVMKREREEETPKLGENKAYTGIVKYLLEYPIV
jgi:chromosome segregation ATPase